MRGNIWQTDVLWEGIPLTDLLTLAKTSPDTIDHIVAESVTGYKAMINADAITDPVTMLSVHM
jgi:DMSO/TMAO reductase YedYZ molybdopterin-dependent catalytic subunit